MMDTTRWFYLHEGCRIVRGQKKGAVYDLIGKHLYRVDLNLLAIIEAGPGLVGIMDTCRAKGVSLADGLRQLETLAEQGLGFFSDKPVFRSPLKDEREARGASSKLLTLTARLDEECNLRCRHCSTGPWITRCLCFRQAALRKDRLSAAEWNRVFEEALQLGCESIRLIGGEPFLHPGITDILRSLTRIGFRRVILFTNGILLKDDVLDILNQLDADIWMPVHSLRPDVHDLITDTTGSWERTIRHLKIIRREKAAVRVYAVVHDQNVDEMPDLANFIWKDLGTDFFLDDYKLGSGYPSNSGPDIRRNGSAGSCRCFASGWSWAWRCVRTLTFPISSAER